MKALAAWAREKRARVARRLFKAMQRTLVLAQYQYINTIDAADKQIRLMNYGWIDPETRAPLMPLEPGDERDRYALQLYHRVASAADLRDKSVLEVGSGRGGGAAYIAKYLGPKRVHGVDLCPSSIAFCNEQYAIPGLSFSQGNAENLRLAPESYDAVVNIESSHCYVRFDAFVRGCHRVLRPGGRLLFADFRPAARIDELRDALTGEWFELVDEEDLNAGVLLALDADDARKRAFIDEKVSRRRRQMFEMFAAIKGSPMYKAFESGEARYVRYVLKRRD